MPGAKTSEFPSWKFNDELGKMAFKFHPGIFVHISICSLHSVREAKISYNDTVLVAEVWSLLKCACEGLQKFCRSILVKSFAVLPKIDFDLNDFFQS